MKPRIWLITYKVVPVQDFDSKGAGSGGGMDWESGISRCKLLYREWINNKVLLHSTGNYIQYPVKNHKGKEYELERINIRITESLCCRVEINIVNQLYGNKTNLKKKRMDSASNEAEGHHPARGQLQPLSRQPWCPP